MITLRWTRGLAALLAGAAMIVGCGGGGGVDTGGTGALLSFGSGPISGFGSVIVGGVRYDDSAASVVDDDGQPLTRASLELGMTVAIEAGEIRADATGSNPAAAASAIRVSSEIVGPVDSVDGNARMLTVLGQTVRVDAATVFDSSLPAGLASLAPGRVVEIYALPDGAGGTYVATRIEPKASAQEWRLRGFVTGLDTTGREFSIGALRVSFAALGAAPDFLADGRLVKVRLALTPSLGVYRATRLDAGAVVPADRDDASFEGIVSALSSATRFRVDGIEVDARSAVFEDGPVAAGQRVEVEGALVGGVLVATKVEIKSEDEASEFELEGAISSIDRTARTFTLQGFTVRYGGDVRFDDGVESDLAVGVEVEVRGTLAGTDRTLAATRIKFDD